MPGLTAVGDNDSPIRVVVTPSQSSYFAGEPFSVTIAYTNTRSPDAGPSKPTVYGHRRGAHSISSAPLARPPTSPGAPRSAIAQTLLKTQALADVPRRKGLIGEKKLPVHGVGQLPNLIEQRRKRQLAPKSLSVSVSPRELENEVEGVIAYTPRSTVRDTPTSPLVPSLARTDSLPLAFNHPHARKQSVLDGQFSLDILSPTTSIPPAPYSANSSTSSFSLALDPIAEAALSPYPSTPAIGSPTIENVTFPLHTPALSATAPTNNSVYAYPPPRNPIHRPNHLGLGKSPSSPGEYAHPIPRTASATISPLHQSDELILYTYAQLTGTVKITPVSGALSTPEQMHTLNAVRSALLRRSMRGGGSMDITSTLRSPSSSIPSKSPRYRTATHSRSSSFSAAGFLSIFSAASLVSSISTPAPGSATTWTGSGRWRSSSMLGPSTTSTSARFEGSSSSPDVLGLGVPNGAGVEEVDPEEPLPTFEVQPAMLAVDLSLAPGESRSYTYTIKLPDNLPPTFKGKSLIFSYEFVVGICRAGASGGSGVSANSISRVMKVPIRMYNHVLVGQALAPYDLLWPICKRIDAGTADIEAKVVEEVRGMQKNRCLVASPNLSSLTDNTLESLRSYAASLVATLPNAKGKPHADTTDVRSQVQSSDSRGNRDSPSADGTGDNMRNRKATSEREDSWRIDGDRESTDECGLTGCREAVELLTRNQKKVSYDVTKDGVKVAVLTFTKTAYRLGETVLGVIELNERTSRARVLKLSAILESHESLPSSISPTSSARHLRRSHAEHHSSFMLNTLRTTFSLDIPSDASPAFQVGVGTSVPNFASSSTPSIPGGLEWKVRLCLLVGIAAETSYTSIQDVRFKSLIRDGPRGEWGTSWGATPGISPLEKPNVKAVAAAQRQQQFRMISPRAWSQFIVSSILYGNASPDTEREYHDGDAIGDEEDGLIPDSSGLAGGDKDYDGIIPDLAGGVGVGVDYANGDEGWQEVKLETVECEVPVKVFPGNTAFKSLDVIFDV